MKIRIVRRPSPGGCRVLLLYLLAFAMTLATSPAIAEAAISCAAVQHDEDSTDKTSAQTYAISSNTITANRLVILIVGLAKSTAGAWSGDPTISLHGATWVKVASVSADDGPRTIWMYRTMVGANSTAAGTVTPPDTAVRGGSAIIECDGVDTSGTTAAAPSSRRISRPPPRIAPAR